MYNHKKYKMEINLSSPVVFNHFNPLDANLTGMLFGGKIVDDIKMDCIAYHDDIPMTSLPIFENKKVNRSVMCPSLKFLSDSSITNRMKPNHTLTESPLSGGDRKNRPFEQTDTVFKYFNTHDLLYYLTGDADRVKQILLKAGAIGAHTSKGYGQISSIRYEEIVNDDLKYCGIFDEEQKLIRPIPIEYTKSLDVKQDQYYGKVARYNPPYSCLHSQIEVENSHIAFPKEWIR